MAEQEKDKFDQWCVLDLFGRQRTAGHVTEATIGGCAFIRIDVPEGEGYRTEYYGNGAIYSMRPVAEEIARKIAAGATAPISAWEIQRLGLGPAPDEHAEMQGDDDDDDDEELPY